MSSNFSSSKEAKISRQMNRSQKLKRKNEAEAKMRNEKWRPTAWVREEGGDDATEASSNQ